jgi:hypothetical protein
MRVFAGQMAQRFAKEGLIVVTAAPRVTDTPAGRKSAHVTGTARRGKRGSVTDTPKRQKLWKHRPFTRVVRGKKAHEIVQDYVRLNEMEALGQIPYRKDRLKALSVEEWRKLWS